ncbi:LysR family transcriptional regulator [Pseudoxanthomonas sp.]|uniref:LysR family transcriptional regulator n=1 Tax=Pseudoxanthomonas sp. TaxID=1871049 RepID=UPI0026200970|nr:LysR family transcriptional regulator [Pseudoxanthomonas sp.]WDS36184.1 MAG: LysR family transcriptional regulator [Pseudoxanthomonas sp.]
MLLKTRHLLLLLHLHEKRSVLRAAEAASMTQPAASKLLAEMEYLVGAPLFQRHARGIEPTMYGDVLARHARAALSELTRAEDEIGALRDGRLGQAAVGTVVNPGTNLVPLAVARVKTAFPSILVRVEMDYSRPLVARLLDGQLDIVIGRIMDAELADVLQFERLADEPHAVIARAGHPLGSKGALTHADLADHGWVVPPESSILRARMGTAFMEHDIAWPDNVIETSALPVITALLIESDFLTVLPARSISAHVEAGLLQILPIDLDVRMEDFGIVRRRHHPLSPAAAHVLAALRETARDLYGPAPRGAGRARR